MHHAHPATNPRSHIHAAHILVLAVLPLLLFPGLATAQSDIRYVDEPTRGLHLPAVPLAGEHDALAVAVNPAGLRFLRGLHLAMAVDLAREESPLPGQGLGFYLATPLGGGLLPEMGLGLGVEFLRSSRTALQPDPGTPVRLSLAYALPLGKNLGFGLSYHRFFDDDASTTSGLSALDLGLSARLGARLALGATLRDLNAPAAAGVRGQRRYELELVTRPTATERLSLALGGGVGEARGNLDGWVRASARLARGVYLHTQLTSRALTTIESTPTSMREEDARELVLTAGLELSLGGLGATFTGTGARAHDGDTDLRGGTLVLRASAEHIPAIQGSQRRIERIELSGAVDERALTAHVLRLRALARDRAVVAVIVAIDDLSAGWATISELRGELLHLRKAGKKVYAHLVVGTTRSYYLATGADKIYVDPAGGVRLTGLAGTSLHYRGLFDRLGVSAEFEKIDEYKSAPESWTHLRPTEPAQRARTEIYDGLYHAVLTGMAEGRGFTVAHMQKLIDSGPYTARELAEIPGFVDAVGNPDELGKLVAADLGRAYPVTAAPRERPARWSWPGIAVIYIEGDIVDGKSQVVPLLGRKLTGGDTIAAAIARARVDPDVKAIVIRVATPGGSAVASEKMAREVFKARKVKPVICSLGNMAASGGYFAAAGCHVIYAEPTTITGSIGIFYGKFDLSGLLSRLGFTWTTYKRGERADMESAFRPYTGEEREVIRTKIADLYHRFVSTVAAGRGLTWEQVDEIGRGRVWTGAQALERRLVDRMGGLADAIAHAKERVGLSEADRVRLVQLPEDPGGLLALILGAASAAPHGRAAGAGELALGLLWLPGGEALLQALPGSLWVQPDAPQARLPFSIIWH